MSETINGGEAPSRLRNFIKEHGACRAGARFVGNRTLEEVWLNPEKLSDKDVAALKRAAARDWLYVGSSGWNLVYMEWAEWLVTMVRYTLGGCQELTQNVPYETDRAFARRKQRHEKFYAIAKPFSAAQRNRMSVRLGRLFRSPDTTDSQKMARSKALMVRLLGGRVEVPEAAPSTKKAKAAPRRRRSGLTPGA